jgi:hypothetical protein
LLGIRGALIHDHGRTRLAASTCLTTQRAGRDRLRASRVSDERAACAHEQDTRDTGARCRSSARRFRHGAAAGQGSARALSRSRRGAAAKSRSCEQDALPTGVKNRGGMPVVWTPGTTCGARRMRWSALGGKALRSGSKPRVPRVATSALASRTSSKEPAAVL